MNLYYQNKVNGSYNILLRLSNSKEGLKVFYIIEHKTQPLFINNSKTQNYNY